MSLQKRSFFSKGLPLSPSIFAHTISPLLCASPVQLLALCEQMSRRSWAVSARSFLGPQKRRRGDHLGRLAKELAELGSTALSLGTALWFRDLAAAFSTGGELLRAPRSSGLAQTAQSHSPNSYLQCHHLPGTLVQTAPQLTFSWAPLAFIGWKERTHVHTCWGPTMCEFLCQGFT